MEIIFLYLCTRYSLINLCLIIGSLKEIRSLLLLWIAFTVGFLIWTFVLVAIMFTYDTTPNFVGGVAIAQLSNFAICGWLVIIWSLVSWVYFIYIIIYIFAIFHYFKIYLAALSLSCSLCTKKSNKKELRKWMEEESEEVKLIFSNRKPKLMIDFITICSRLSKKYALETYFNINV